MPLLTACPELGDVFGHPADAVPSCDEVASRERVDEDDDIHGFDGCRPAPARLVVLGDASAALCDGAFAQIPCGSALLAEHLRGSLGRVVVSGSSGSSLGEFTASATR